MRPERHNAVKLLLFLDVGGSMDDHVKATEELFSAATSEFKNMEFYYFHNCLYESVWNDNSRRWSERIPTWDLLHKFGHDYKIIFVGDATMSPYEVAWEGVGSWFRLICLCCKLARYCNTAWQGEASPRLREKWPASPAIPVRSPRLWLHCCSSSY